MPMLTMFLIGLPVCPFQAPLRILAGEVGHAIEHGVDLGHDVFAVDQDRLTSRSAQGHVQDGAVLGDVDLLAAKHGVDASFQARFLGQLQQQAERLVGDAVLGVIEEEPRGLGRQPLAAAGIVGEQTGGDARRASSDDELPGPSRRGGRVRYRAHVVIPDSRFQNGCRESLVRGHIRSGHR